MPHLTSQEPQTRFVGPILAIDEAIADRWGWITAQAQVKGMTLPVVAGLIACALAGDNRRSWDKCFL